MDLGNCYITLARLLHTYGEITAFTGYWTLLAFDNQPSSCDDRSFSIEKWQIIQ